MGPSTIRSGFSSRSWTASAHWPTPNPAARALFLATGTRSSRSRSSQRRSRRAYRLSGVNYFSRSVNDNYSSLRQHARNSNCRRSPANEGILDGEIIHIGTNGIPQFYDLMRRRRAQHFYAFDLLWLDGRDLQDRPLPARKRLLRRIVPPQPSPVLYLDHIAEVGVKLFHAVSARDTEGIVATLAKAGYTPGQNREPVQQGGGAGGFLRGRMAAG
jgi:hypothetical protein